MNNFVFENTTKVYFGRKCVKEYLTCLLKKYSPGNTIMLAYGRNSIKKNKIYDEIITILKSAGNTIVEFPNIMQNPTYEKVLEGATLAREKNVDFILGVGGGSVMDCSKAIAMAAVSKEDIWDNFYSKSNILNFDPIPLGVIDTTAGSGSECNGYAAITNEKLKIKTGQDYSKCNPKFALLAPDYTYSVPIKQMVAGSFSILSQIMETYFSRPNEDNVSDDISEALMKNIIRNLKTAVQNSKDYTARSNLLWDSAMGENHIIRLGKNLNQQCRQIGYQLSAYTNCKHGHSLAVIQPAYYYHLYPFELSKFVRFAENIWNVSAINKTKEETALAGIKAFSDFIKEIDLPVTLRELGVKKTAVLEEISVSCKIPSSNRNVLTNKEILNILKKCF